MSVLFVKTYEFYCRACGDTWEVHEISEREAERQAQAHERECRGAEE